MENRKITPQLTVLMTVFNGGQYLRRSVQSILDQTYSNFEFLIVDDASTDDSLEVINSFNDDRVCISCNRENIGQSKSLNIGLKLAKGKYVARIDADDIALPTWLEKQYSFIESHSDYAVVSTKAVVIDEHNKIKRIYHSPVSQEDIILRSFTFSPINHVGCILNRKVVLDNGGYVEKYKIAADYGLWSNLIRGGHKMTSTEKVLIAIRAHSNSLSQAGSGSEELQDLSDIMQANINAFTRCQIDSAESNLLCRTFFDEGSLNNAEFDQSRVLLREIYGSLNPSLNIGKECGQKWAKKRCMAAYLKRVYFFIGKRDYGAVREVLRQGINEFGFFSLLGLLFMFNFLGKALLNGVPKLSDQLMRTKAYFLMKKKFAFVRF